MQGREAGTGAPETCSFPPALPNLLCDSGPSQLTTTKWPARPGLDLTVTTCARFPGIMERVTVMLNRPCLTDGEIEAQWWERAEPQVAQHISCKGQLETRRQLSVLQFWALARSMEKASPPLTLSFGGDLVGVLRHSGLGPGLLCV